MWICKRPKLGVSQYRECRHSPVQLSLPEIGTIPQHRTLHCCKFGGGSYVIRSAKLCHLSVTPGRIQNSAPKVLMHRTHLQKFRLLAFGPMLYVAVQRLWSGCVPRHILNKFKEWGFWNVVQDRPVNQQRKDAFPWRTENRSERIFVRNIIYEAGNTDVTGYESSSKSVAIRLLTRTDTHTYWHTYHIHTKTSADTQTWRRNTAYLSRRALITFYARNLYWNKMPVINQQARYSPPGNLWTRLRHGVGPNWHLRRGEASWSSPETSVVCQGPRSYASDGHLRRKTAMYQQCTTQCLLKPFFFRDSVVHEFTCLRVKEFKSRNQNCPAQHPTAARMQEMQKAK